MTRSTVVLVVLTFAAGFVTGRGSNAPSRPSEADLDVPLVPALRDVDRTPRVVEATALLDWARADDPIVVIDNYRDTLPNGLTLKAVPLLVDWGASEGQDHYVVRNVNVSCDPLRATTTLATVRIPKRGLESAEFVYVRDRAHGRNEQTGHGLLRFVFEADARPEIVVPEGSTWHGERRLDDVLISYEAWRAAGEVYNAFEGMRSGVYALNCRCYGGSAYYLQTALKQYAWEAYPLELEGGRATDEELLRVGLLIGDALGRRVIADMVADGEVSVPDASQLVEWSDDDTARARAFFSQDRVPEDPIQDLVGDGDVSYNTLQRSCMTASMATIDLVQRRAVERAGKEHVPLAVAPTDVPEWATELATASREEVLTRVPGALVWLAENQNVVPANAWRILRDGGLLRRDGDRVVRHVYLPEGVTPWGRVVQNL